MIEVATSTEKVDVEIWNLVQILVSGNLVSVVFFQ